MPPDAAPAHDTLASQHQQVLAELTRMGLDIARTLHAQVTAPPTAEPATPATPIPDLAAAFDRVSRGVRRTVLLAQHLLRPAPATRPAAPDNAQTTAQTLARARRHLLRAVENKIARNDERPENPDALRRELRERLEGDDIADDLLHRPLPDVVADLCRDMGLDRWPFAPPYPRRTPADIARLLAQAEGRPGPDSPASLATPPWTHSSPPWLGQPRGKPDRHGITPEDRALHAHILAGGRKPR